MAFTHDELKELNQAIASGSTSVTYKDRSETYRSLDEMLQLRSLMMKELGVRQRPAERVQRASFDKGYQ